MCIRDSSPALSEHLALQAQRGHDLAGDFLDGSVRGAERGNALHLEHGFRRRYFLLVGFKLCVGGIGAPFLADLLQAFRIDGQAEQLAPVGAQAWRQAVAFQVFIRQRIVGRADAVMQRKVDTSGRLARTRYRYQDQVGFVVVCLLYTSRCV